MSVWLCLVCHGRLDLFPQAAIMYNAALRMQEAALGPQHPDIARTLHNLADVLQVQGKLDEVRKAVLVLHCTLEPSICPHCVWTHHAWKRHPVSNRLQLRGPKLVVCNPRVLRYHVRASTYARWTDVQSWHP